MIIIKETRIMRIHQPDHFGPQHTVSMHTWSIV